MTLLPYSESPPGSRRNSEDLLLGPRPGSRRGSLDSPPNSPRGSESEAKDLPGVKVFSEEEIREAIEGAANQLSSPTIKGESGSSGSSVFDWLSTIRFSTKSASSSSSNRLDSTSRSEAVSELSPKKALLFGFVSLVMAAGLVALLVHLAPILLAGAAVAWLTYTFLGMTGGTALTYLYLAGKCFAISASSSGGEPVPRAAAFRAVED